MPYITEWNRWLFILAESAIEYIQCLVRLFFLFYFSFRVLFAYLFVQCFFELSRKFVWNFGILFLHTKFFVAHILRSIDMCASSFLILRFELSTEKNGNEKVFRWATLTCHLNKCTRKNMDFTELEKCRIVFPHKCREKKSNKENMGRKKEMYIMNVNFGLVALLAFDDIKTCIYAFIIEYYVNLVMHVTMVFSSIFEVGLPNWCHVERICVSVQGSQLWQRYATICKLLVIVCFAKEIRCANILL